MHLSLRVSSLERSLAFYQAFFGAPPHKVRPGYANFDLAEPPLKFALNEGPMQPGAGPLDHLGLQVMSRAAVDEARQRLQDAGLATFDEGDTTCCYALQDKIWVHDPDGNAWEVYVLLNDLLDDYDHDHVRRPLDSTASPDRSFRTSGAAILLAGAASAEPGAACCGSDDRS
jgi:catechol 2,3-dioxygenase-like lactoylglutathione lyase family enzyme